MKRTIFAPFAATLILILTASASAQTAKPNFSGTWTLDLAKSDFGPMPPPDSMSLVVDHKEPNLKVTSTQKSQQGEVTNERRLTTDGKPNANKIKSVDSEQDVTSTSKWDAQKLVTSYTLDVQGMKFDLVDTWDLSADGKTLTVLRIIKTDEGPLNMKTVFTKQ